MQDILLEWNAPEYPHQKKSVDWYWAVGIITIAGTVASFIFNNYLFGMFVLISGILAFYFSIRKPEDMHFSITGKGIIAGTIKYTYEGIKFFAIERKQEHSMLLLLTERVFMPIVTVPIPIALEQQIFDIMIGHGIEEEDLREPGIYKLLEKAGF